MMGHTHFTFGALFGAIAIKYAQIEPTIAFFVGTQLGSLAPDLDHPQALISKKVPMSSVTIGRLRHRTLTHSLFGLALVYAIGKYVIPPVWDKLWHTILQHAGEYANWLTSAQSHVSAFLGDGFLLGFMIGYVSHIFIDLFNPMGVQLFYPLDFLPNKGWVHPPFGLGIKTGSIGELIFTLVSLFIAIYIDWTLGAITAVITIITWILLGKPGIPKFRL